ncbi:phage tail protein [Methylomonas sp. 2BW1-5-20]|uniref:phage tail protein n=1 Tax=Methylomonas sp. 2BW1-5-20 TaxID=3376686 RepID=UPI00404E16EB
MAISTPPAAPSRSDPPDVFIPKADAFLAWLATAAVEFNTAVEAMNLNAVTANSSTSLAIGTGSKSLTVDAAKSYVPGMTVKVAATADGTKWMLGDVTSYNSTTGALVVVVSVVQGSGTFAAWTITQAAPGGAAPGANHDITSLDSPDIGSAIAVTQGNGDNSTKVATTAYVDRAVPAGEVIGYGGSTPPAGFLAIPTAPTNVSRTTYAALFAAIGTTWGAGDGSTTFGIPWVPVGYTWLQGSSVGSATVGQNLAHTHTVNSLQGGTGGIDLFGGAASVAGPTVTTSSQGGSANLAAGHTIKFCIKY